MSREKNVLRRLSYRSVVMPVVRLAGYFSVYVKLDFNLTVGIYSGKVPSCGNGAKDKAQLNDISLSIGPE
jgi:hypothetical protein